MTRFLTAPIMYALLALLALSAGFGVVQTVRLAGEKEDHADARTKHAQVLADIATKTQAAAAAAIAARDAYNTSSAAASIARAKGESDAYQRGMAVTAGINAGTVRVQDLWRVCGASGATAGDAADLAGGHSAEDQRRAAAIGRILGKGGKFDAQYERTYAELISTRALLAKCYEDPK